MVLMRARMSVPVTKMSKSLHKLNILNVLTEYHSTLYTLTLQGTKLMQSSTLRHLQDLPEPGSAGIQTETQP